MTKAEWLEEGKALGARASDSGWEIGKWLVQGEEQFLGTAPSSKKGEAYLLRKPSRKLDGTYARGSASHKSVRHYAAPVCEHCPQGACGSRDFLFSHHLLKRYARRTMQYVNPKRESELRFDHQAARDLLNLAKEKGWTAAETRAEAVRRFPTPKPVESVLQKAKRTLVEILKTVDGYNDKLEFLDALTAELSQVREQVSLEWDAEIQRIFNEGNDTEVPFESNDVPY